MPYNPALDGLRAVAIIMVVLFHARAPFAPGGFIGVDLFFVLSGYLITSLLLAEHDATGRIDLARFYVRRLLRLTPALFAMLAVYVLVAPLVWPGVAHWWHAVVAALYLADYGAAFWGVPEFVGPAWSLSVEEHFYLLWPLALLLLVRRGRSLARVLAIAYVLSVLWRLACVLDGQGWNAVYLRFDTRLSGLIVGAWLATVRRDQAGLAMLRWFLPGLWLPVLALAFACWHFRWGQIGSITWGLVLAEWSALALLVAIDRGGPVAALLSRAPIVWLGKLSYGVYLWHYPVIRYLREILPWHEALLIGMSVSIALAAAPYWTVEAWARRARRRPGLEMRKAPRPEGQGA